VLAINKPHFHKHFKAWEAWYLSRALSKDPANFKEPMPEPPPN